MNELKKMPYIVPCKWSGRSFSRTAHFNFFAVLCAFDLQLTQPNYISSLVTPTLSKFNQFM